MQALSDNPAELAGTVLQWRLSRALTAFSTGGALALAGVMMQALLRNPLADPYVLGISGGASVGALLVLFLAGTAWMVSAGALAGALLIALLLYVLVCRESEPDTSASPLLLLTGVVLACGCGAVIAILLSIAPDGNLRGMLFWLIGDLEGTRFGGITFGVLLAVLLYALRIARPVNLLALHAESAQTLGVPVALTRKALFACSAALTACAVANTGSIGFVGLIAPHACRLLLGTDHRWLFPASLLAGGGFLVLADTLSRVVAAPQQLPVGAVTALIGVPLFLFQLYQVRRG